MRKRLRITALKLMICTAILMLIGAMILPIGTGDGTWTLLSIPACCLMLLIEVFR